MRPQTRFLRLLYIYDVVDKKKEMDHEIKEELVKGLYWKQKEMVHGTDKVEDMAQLCESRY
jgi:hypothetical protein